MDMLTIIRMLPKTYSLSTTLEPDKNRLVQALENSNESYTRAILAQPHYMKIYYF